LLSLALINLDVPEQLLISMRKREEERRRKRGEINIIQLLPSFDKNRLN
jgi:hypothetical protein